jgi:hypothetical protein
MATYPQFGAQGGFMRTTKSDRSDQAELVRGRVTEVLVRSISRECSSTLSDCTWGIEPDGDIIFDTIRLTIEDELDQNYTAAQTTSIDPTLPLVKTKCCIIRRARVTLTIDGKGDIGYHLGDTTIPTMITAIGSPVLDMTALVNSLSVPDFRIINYTLTDTDQDWQRFTAEYLGYIEANADGDPIANVYMASAGVEPPAGSCECSDLEPNGCCNSYRVEWTMNGEGFTEITGTVTLNPMAAGY